MRSNKVMKSPDSLILLFLKLVILPLYSNYINVFIKKKLKRGDSGI
nr:MAG TPA: hypothetical protein [Caudoviricetes sp.]